MLEVPERSRPYLRRAYSVADVDRDRGEVEFLVKTIGPGTSALERLTLESSLRRALERDEFELHYQPKIDFPTGRITGVEALLRWRHPERGTS